MIIVEILIGTVIFASGVVVGVVLREKEIITCEDIQLGADYIVDVFTKNKRRVVRIKPKVTVNSL